MLLNARTRARTHTCSHDMREHTRAPATTSSIKIPTGVLQQRALIRTRDKKIVSLTTERFAQVRAHSLRLKRICARDKCNNIRITPGGLSGARCVRRVLLGIQGTPAPMTLPRRAEIAVAVLESIRSYIN